MSLISTLQPTTQLIESVKVSDGQLHNWSYHSMRMKEASIAIYGVELAFDIDTLAFDLSDCTTGIYKLRILYDAQSCSHELQPYILKPIHSLKLVFDDEINYQYKSADRSQLKALFEKRADCDDVVIVKAGKLTDSYFCNVALEKAGQWYTPKAPLLAGTKRAQLLDDRTIIEADIELEQIYHYSRIRLFNAMVEFGEYDLPMTHVY